MKKIFSDAICVFIGILIGLIIMTPINGGISMFQISLPLFLLLIAIASIICSMLKYFFI